MKSIFLKITYLLIFIISLTSCAQKSDSKSETHKVQNNKEIIVLISSVDLNKKLGEIQLIDVRTPEEFAKGHIKNAININFFDDDFMSEMSKLEKNKDIYIYCQGGVRSGKAAVKLESLGFNKVYDLKGGISSWNNSDFEIVK